MNSIPTCQVRTVAHPQMACEEVATVKVCHEYGRVMLVCTWHADVMLADPKERWERFDEEDASPEQPADAEG